MKRRGRTVISCGQRLHCPVSRNQRTRAPSKCSLFQHEGLGSCQARPLLQLSRRVLEIMSVYPCDMALTASTNRGYGFHHTRPRDCASQPRLACQNAGLVSPRLSRLLYFIVKPLLGAPHALSTDFTCRLSLLG